MDCLLLPHILSYSLNPCILLWHSDYFSCGIICFIWHFHQSKVKLTKMGITKLEIKIYLNITFQFFMLPIWTSNTTKQANNNQFIQLKLQIPWIRILSLNKICKDKDPTFYWIPVKRGSWNLYADEGEAFSIAEKSQQNAIRGWLQGSWTRF